MNAAIGKLIGVGTGPGDPELLTLKAVRALGEAQVVAHFAKRGSNGNARATISAHLRPDVIELPLVYPVTTEIDRNDGDYKAAIGDFARGLGFAHVESGPLVRSSYHARKGADAVARPVPAPAVSGG